MKRVIVLAVLAACDAALDQRLAIVREPRVLAVISEPAEAKPGGAVSYAALVAGPQGPITATPHWALCTAPKAPTEDNAVSDACLANDQLVDLGTAQTVATTLPADACIQFGPDVPPGGFRPRDADATGGYYQPVRVDPIATGSDLGFGFSRITCNLPNAPGDIAQAYRIGYAANRNPTATLSVAPAAITAGATVTVTASWPAGAAEDFLYYDPQSQTLVPRREAIRVSWFATGGALAVDASAVAERSLATRVSTVWQAPGAGPAWLWIVLRDSRGGIATQTLAMTVE